MSKMNKKLIIAIAAIVTAAFLVGVYIAFFLYFQKRFFPGTSINGVDCSGKTVEEAMGLIDREASSYVLVLEGRNGVTDEIYGEDIRLRTVFDGSLDRLLKQQNSLAWIVEVFGSRNYRPETLIAFDRELLEQEISKLGCMDEAKMEKPVSASLEYSDKSGYSIVKAQYGTTVKPEVLRDKIFAYVENMGTNLVLAQEGCYIEPEYTEDSAEVTEAFNTLNRCLGAEITYHFGSKTEVLGRQNIQSWVSVDGNFQVSLDRAKVLEYVKSLSGKYDTYGKTREFKSSYGPTVTVVGGNYGWKIDVEKETDELIAQLQQGGAVSREPVYSARGASHDGADYGNTYVEINLMSQHLFFYKDGAKVLESDIVTGKPEGGHATPPGSYAITYTEKDSILRGENYATPVAFWMPFNGDIGLHDATWQPAFGGSRYLRNGSLGCVNLPYGVAQQLFASLKTGDPVILYSLNAGVTVSPEEVVEEEKKSTSSFVDMLRRGAAGSSD